MRYTSAAYSAVMAAVTCEQVAAEHVLKGAA